MLRYLWYMGDGAQEEYGLIYALAAHEGQIIYVELIFCNYSKRHNKFLFPALAGAIYGSFCKAENEISNVVNYLLRYSL